MLSRIRNAASGWLRIAVLLLLAMVMSPPARHLAAGSLEKGVREIGSRLELFVDDWLIGRMDYVRLALHRPQPAEVAIDSNKDWEGDYSAYVTVFPDGDLFRMYYRGVGVEQDAKQVTCYAESRDGIHWTRPSLDIHEFEGFSANNIVWVDKGSHNFAPFKDSNPDAPSDQRYKALAGGPLRALVSADGLHWKLLKEDVISDGPSILRIWASGSRFARNTSPSTGISSGLPVGVEDPFYRNSRHQDRHLTKLCRLDRRSVGGLSGCSPEALCFML